MRLIDADALRKKAHWMEIPDWRGINFDVKAVSVSSIDLAPTVDAIKVGSCDGCYWKDKGRFQKCTYCRRNQNMKDRYLERGAFDG